MDTIPECRTILLIATKSNDAYRIRDHWHNSSPSIQLSIVEDGVEARAFLRREKTHADAPRPELIVLDLDLPRKDGLDILGDIKSDPNLRSIPVIVLTPSDAAADMGKAYALDANCCILKPPTLGKLCNVILSIQEHWFNVVRLPKGDLPGEA